VATSRPEASVHGFLKPFTPLLEDPDVTEIVINGNNQVAFEKDSIWTPSEIELDGDHALSLGTAVGRYVSQTWSEKTPLLSASVPMPGQFDPSGLGEARELRFQLVCPAAVPRGSYSITMRKPAMIERSLDDFDKSGLFASVKPAAKEVSESDQNLLSLRDSGMYKEFLSRCVRERKNIVVAGATGSGKTTFMKGLVNEIPLNERLVTIEDVRELRLPHWNKVHLLYSKGGQGSSDVSAKQLLEACLRMKPSRILLAELRGDECLYYVRNAASGHPGSITSVHAGTPALAFEQMALLIKDSPGGAYMDMAVIMRLLKLTIDVIVQFQNIDGKRFISEIWFDPQGKIQAGEIK
jgi:type IV secretion system protein VirB11